MTDSIPPRQPVPVGRDSVATLHRERVSSQRSNPFRNAGTGPERVERVTGFRGCVRIHILTHGLTVHSPLGARKGGLFRATSTLYLCYTYPMSDTETPPPEVAPAPKNKGGRPRRADGVDPTRSAGRHGKIWDDCVKQAKDDNQTMTDFVGEAITRELARRQRLARIAKANAAFGPPDEEKIRDGDLRRLDTGQLQEWGSGRWHDVPELPTAAVEAPAGWPAAADLSDPDVIAVGAPDTAGTDWPATARDLASGDPERIASHLAAGIEATRARAEVEQQGAATSPGYDTDGEGNPVEAFACDTCGLEFDTRAQLDGHEAENTHDDGMTPVIEPTAGHLIPAKLADPPAFPAAMVEAFTEDDQ